MPQRCSNPACTAAATFTCSRCHAAHYCGAPCQRAHWRAHRPGCTDTAGAELASLRPLVAAQAADIERLQAEAEALKTEVEVLRSAVSELRAGGAGLAAARDAAVAESASAQARELRSGAAAAAQSEELAELRRMAKALRREVDALAVALAQARSREEGAAPTGMALAGGAGGTTLLSSVHLRLLPYFDTCEACALRLVCREMRSAMAAHQWQDRETVILGSIGGWRACFPRARCANVRCFRHSPVYRKAPVVDADFVHFVGLWELNMARCVEVTDAAFVHLRGIRVLDMSNCNQHTITDAGLAHLVGIQKLCMWGCSQATLTDAAFAALRGIRVLNMSLCPQITDAAFVHLKGIHTLLIWACHHPTITDAALAHLKGIRCLVLDHCSIPFTEVGLVHLRGITRLHMEGANAASVAAARDLGLPVTTGAYREW